MFRFGGLGALFGGLNPQKPSPRGDGTDLDSTNLGIGVLLRCSAVTSVTR